MKGIIALDIDGTITYNHQPISFEVISTLKNLAEQGWIIIFITGRTFHWGYSVLHPLDFPYYFAVQNGAIILSMPHQEIIFKKYLSQTIIPTLEKICDDEPTDFVIYTGFEYNNTCFYRANHFSPQLLDYLLKRQIAFQENWIDVPSFSTLEVNGIPIHSFPSIKCFGEKQSIERITKKVENQLKLHMPPIRDPFYQSYFVGQATHPDVNKGQVLSDLKNILAMQSQPTIVAGDDNNDIPMFLKGDIKIAMADSSEQLLKLADVIAPQAQNLGIIKGLKEAINLLKIKREI